MNLLPLTVLVTAATLAVATALVVGCTGRSAPGAQSGEGGETRFVGRVYDESGNLRDAASLTKIVKPEAEWKAELDPKRYRILREHGTERPFTGELLGNTAEGVYHCAACELPLFTSDTKFKSGTGWPSFFRSIAAGNVGETSDRTLGMVRTEIHCARCGGHLGHVFQDGPPPTGQRYCVNSLSLEFTPNEKLATLAEPLTMNDTPGVIPDDAASAIFAGGCFWCVEAVFEELDGVYEAVSGYAGGTAETADYKAVSAGRTKHAEAVKIVYDPNKITYDELLRVHFATHDPTTLNRQGNDVGPQYRSAIFYADEQEKTVAKAFIDDLNEQKVFGASRVVTTLEPLTKFYEAERHHQDYVCQNPNQGYVRVVALPKVEKVRKQFKDKLKKQSPLEKAGR